MSCRPRERQGIRDLRHVHRRGRGRGEVYRPVHVVLAAPPVEAEGPEVQAGQTAVRRPGHAGTERGAVGLADEDGVALEGILSRVCRC